MRRRRVGLLVVDVLLIPCALSRRRSGVWLCRIHCQEAAALGLFGVGCVTFSVYGRGACLFSFRVSKGVLGPWPRGCCFGLVWARLRHVVCLRTRACLFSFRGSKAAFRHAAEDGFLLRLRPDLGGVWLFWVHRREVAAWGLSGLGCVALSVYGLGLVSSPLGVPKLHFATLRRTVFCFVWGRI